MRGATTGSMLRLFCQLLIYASLCFAVTSMACLWHAAQRAFTPFTRLIARALRWVLLSFTPWRYNAPWRYAGAAMRLQCFTICPMLMLMPISFTRCCWLMLRLRRAWCDYFSPCRFFALMYAAYIFIYIDYDWCHCWYCWLLIHWRIDYAMPHFHYIAFWCDAILLILISYCFSFYMPLFIMPCYDALAYALRYWYLPLTPLFAFRWGFFFFAALLSFRFLSMPCFAIAICLSFLLPYCW